MTLIGLASVHAPFRDRDREFALTGDLLSFVSPNEKRQSKGDSAECFAVELAAR
ncbi:hypothetical protein AX13_03105 [Comamonas aquatica DA1877]|uniref:Uncharacterized protein n=1 Tax=Comamonas aquatica DA1877 TaxID=1457173 RepID=A0A014NK97_9BURK|nr:hypothetical protein AX13_03105 [Comamonas aquatica DA1877]